MASGAHRKGWLGAPRGFRGEDHGGSRRLAIGRHRVIAAMPVAAARLAFLLDIRNFAARGHFAVPADDAAAGERGEAEKPNETHDALHQEKLLSNLYAVRWR